MATPIPSILLRVRYEKAADAALVQLTLEQIMEATPSATQRRITLASFDELAGERPDVHLYNELLVLYQLPDSDEIQRVVPGNMVVLAEQRPVVDRSWNIPLQPARPFLMFEYVSPSHLRKDYEDNLIRYEQHLQTPYYLLFQPEAQELILYHLVGSRYVSVKPNAQGRYPIPELEMEIGIVDGWVRYWFRGELLELPSVMRRELRESREATQRAKEQANNATRRAEQFEAQAEKARQEAEVARLAAAQSDANARRAREEADQERAARLALLQELEALRRQLGQTPPANEE